MAKKGLLNMIFSADGKAADVVNNIINKVDRRIDTTSAAIKGHNEALLAFPYDPSQCTSLKGFELAQKLQAVGFTNITLIGLNDLKGGFFDKFNKRDETVSEVLINGKSNFKKNKAINKNASIVISFHCIRGTFSSQPYQFSTPEQYIVESQAPVLSAAPSYSPALPDSTDPPKRKFCSYCGARLDTNSRFCSGCGKPVA